MANEVKNCCLYFASNRLNRVIAKLAEETFKPLGFSPTYAYLLMEIKDHPGISSKALAEELFIAQSTLTRLVDKMMYHGYVERTITGRNSIISLTKEGEDIQEQIVKYWRKLYHKYSEIISYEKGEEMVKEINDIAEALENGVNNKKASTDKDGQHE